MPEQTEPDIRHALDAAERELLDRLEESCSLEPEGAGAESTGELIRLEDALSSAARAAEQALQLRRKLRGIGADPASGDPAGGVREFRDEQGTSWRVWAVRPPRERLEAGGKRFLADYREGWLAFEALDESARRRLPTVPKDWKRLDDAGLRALLESAIAVRPRLRRDGLTEIEPD